MSNSLHWWSRLAKQVRAAGRGEIPAADPIRTVRDGLGFDCATLVGNARPGNADFQPVLVNIDYPGDVIGFIATTYARSCPGHDYALRDTVASTFEDLPFDFRSTRTFREILEPNGFLEGVTLPLAHDQPGIGRPGFLAMSSTHNKPLERDAKLALTVLSHELGGLLSPGHDSHAVLSDLVVSVKASGIEVRVGNLKEANLSICDLRDVIDLVKGEGNIGQRLRLRGNDGEWWQATVASTGGRVLVRMSRKEIMGGLTPRELDVVGLVARGWTNDGIAQGLGISVRTTRSHIESALMKLDASNRTKLARIAFEHGLESVTALRLGHNTTCR